MRGGRKRGGRGRGKGEGAAEDGRGKRGEGVEARRSEMGGVRCTLTLGEACRVLERLAAGARQCGIDGLGAESFSADAGDVGIVFGGVGGETSLGGWGEA